MNPPILTRARDVALFEKEQLTERARGPSACGCLLCGNARRVRPYPRSLPWLWRCMNCGLRFAAPQPTDDELAEIYGPHYFAMFGCDTYREGAYRAAREATFQRLLAIAERLVPPGSLLDIGSGTGDFMRVASRRGWRVQGVEPNPWACQSADRVLPGATLNCTIEAFDASHGQFDLVTCIDVLEHVRQPDRLLRRVRTWLRPGGLVLVTTPDVNCLLSRVLARLWPHYHIDHLWYFSRTTLPALARLAELDVVACVRAKKVFNIAYIAGALEQNVLIRRGANLLRGLTRRLPRSLSTVSLPAMREGRLLVARKAPEHKDQITSQNGLGDLSAGSRAPLAGHSEQEA